jgi:predicted transcriptional regulator
MYKQIFQKAGLTPTQAAIMEYLFNKKEDKASEIAKQIKKSRAIVYKDLEEMVVLNIVERVEKPNAISYFRIGHPAQMEKFFDQKESQIKKDRELFNNYLPDMVSSYNLLSNKPGVKYYEGEAGIWKILDDTLTSKTEILTIADVEAVDKYLREINKEYVAKRNKKGIKKRLLALDSPYARNHFSNASELTDVKLINLQITPFSTSLHIYDNKIAYITMTEKNLSGTLIEDKNIFSMHRALFELIWSS